MMKKAQVKMAENIAVLILFIFLIVIGLIFYTSYKSSSLAQERQELEIENAIEVASRVAFLPELQCGEDSIQVHNCIDRLKLEAVRTIDLFNNPTDKNQVYFGILRYSTIVLKEVYPGSSEHVLYDFKRPEIRTQEFIPIPIVIYDPVQGESAFGVLEVTVYG